MKSQAFKLLIQIVSVVWISEALIMGLFEFLPKMPPIVEALIDASLLSVIVYLCFWYWISKPLRQENSEKTLELDSYIKALKKFAIISKTDIHGQITYANQHFANISGYTIDELVGKDHRLINSDYHPKSFFKTMWDDLLQGRPWQGHIKNKNKNGTEYWVNSTIIPVFDQNEKIKEFVSVRYDITHEKKIAENLVNSTRFYEKILENFSEGYVLFNQEGIAIRYNQSALNILGLNSSELNHLSIYDPAWSKIKESGQFFSFEEEPVAATLKTRTPQKDVTMGICRTDQKLTWIKANTILFSSKTAQIDQGVLFTFSDITAQIDKNMKLVESEKRLKEAQRIGQIGNWSYEFDSKKIVWSDQMFDLFRPLNQMRPPTYEDWIALLHPDDQVTWSRITQYCLKSLSPISFRFRLLRRFKEADIWIKGICHPHIDSNTKSVIGLYGTCQDITAQVDLEKKLEFERAKSTQAAKLASLGQMSAGIAHEINNPLTIIVGMTNLIHRCLQNPQELQHKIDSIRNGAQRISKIVDGLKKFSRTSDSNLRHPRKVSKIIEEGLLLTHLKSKQHDVKIDYIIDVECEILCQEIEIEQVVVNLINNSIDAVKDFDNRWIKVSVFQTDNQAVIQISDSGKGFTENSKKNLFQPFFTTKEIGEGTGLGLSICKGIIEDHAGTINLIEGSEHTCFEVRLPLLAHDKNIVNESSQTGSVA